MIDVHHSTTNFLIGQYHGISRTRIIVNRIDSLFHSHHKPRSKVRNLTMFMKIATKKGSIQYLIKISTAIP